MLPHDHAEEVIAGNEAERLFHANPKEAPELLESVIAQYITDGKLACAFEARRWQCFALIANLEYEKAADKIAQFIAEATAAKMPIYVGYADMSNGLMYAAIGDFDGAIESLERAIEVASEEQNLDLILRVQVNIAYVQVRQERYEDAIQTLKQTLRQFENEPGYSLNATIFYGIAAARLQVAFRNQIEGNTTEECLELAQAALITADQNCLENSHLTLMTELMACLFIGLSGNPEKGLQDLLELEETVQKSAGSHLNIFWVTKCQLLELAQQWEVLCDESIRFLNHIERSQAWAFYVPALKQSARALAQIGNYQQAFENLSRCFNRPDADSRPNIARRAKIASMQLDLERQRFDQDILRMRNKSLIERNKILEQEARFDPLSALLNRRGTEEVLQQYCERKFADRFTIALLDIDHFKRINDKFGHAIGDQVINEFSACLSESSTNPAKVGRWGGEEFLIIFENTDFERMNEIGKALVNDIRSLNWDHIHAGMKVTASVGLSMWKKGDSLDNAVRIADDMLYEVKHHGRDNWRVWSHDEAA